MNKNTLRAALIAGLIGSASLGLAGAANAAVTPHQDWAIGTPAAHSQQFAGHKSDDEGGSEEGPAQDVAAMDDGGSAPEEPAAADPAPEAPEAPEAPAEPAANEPEPATPADAPADAPADVPAEAPVDTPDAPVDTTDASPLGDAPAPSQDDINVAHDADPVLTDPAPAESSEVQEMTDLVTETMSSETTQSIDEWNHEVTEWNSSWVSYDSYNRPVLLNPYNDPMQVFYTYDNAPRIVTVPPLQSVALNAPTAGVYPFTTVVKSPTGPIRQVSVGSFTGGGPQAVQPATAKNVLVALRYAAGSSQPFRVKTLADLGDDSAIGARRVLIDGVTTAWGQWSKAPGGEREFVITKTQPLPGLGAPAEAPLPGYNVAITKR